MSLQVPHALWALLGIAVLLLLQRYRRRPRARVWSSLVIWRAVATDGTPPKKRRRDPLLLLECAALALLALAAAGPRFVTKGIGRTVVVLFDEGPHMDARRGDQTVREASRAEWERLRQALDPTDRIVEFFETGPIRVAALSLPPADLRVVVTDRNVSGRDLTVIGRTADGPNRGLDAVEVTGDSIWFVVRADLDRALSVSVGARTVEVRPGVGTRVPLATAAGARGATTIRIAGSDPYPADDTCTIEPATLVARDDTGSRFVRAALFGAGVRATGSGEPDLVIANDGGATVPGVIRGAECIASPGVFQTLMLEDCVWRGARMRRGVGLLMVRGRALAQWHDARTLWLGLPLDRDWDEHGTLAMLIDAAKQERLRQKAGDAHLTAGYFVRPAPRFVSTLGTDRPFNGTLPASGAERTVVSSLRMPLALAALLLLLFYLRAIVRAR